MVTVVRMVVVVGVVRMVRVVVVFRVWGGQDGWGV